MKKVVPLLATMLLTLTSLPATADRFVSSHYCSKPYVPSSFSSSSERENLKYEVEQYKSCIEDYVDEQNDAIKKHREAAEDAIDEWNSFVNYELR
jgi:hypothetical protein